MEVDKLQSSSRGE